MGIISRVKKLEKMRKAEFFEIQKLVLQGAYYDELSEDQKETYRRYKESIGGVADDISGAELEILINGISKKDAYHFQLSPRKRPPTEEEMKQIVEEVESYFSEKKKEFNREK